MRFGIDRDHVSGCGDSEDERAVYRVISRERRIALRNTLANRGGVRFIRSIEEYSGNVADKRVRAEAPEDPKKRSRGLGSKAVHSTQQKAKSAHS